jgi:ankyrin repeat protein
MTVRLIQTACPRLSIIEATFISDTVLPALADLAESVIQLTRPMSPAVHRRIVSSSPLRTCLQAALAAQGPSQQSPLHVAVMRHDTATVRSLLLIGTKHINAKDYKGYTPLARAVELGHTDCVVALVEAGADLWVRNGAMETPLFLGALKKHVPCVQALLTGLTAQPMEWSSRNDPARFFGGWTPIMGATLAQSTAMLDLLLSHGFDTTATNKYGQTALHLAATAGFAAGVERLVQSCPAATLLVRDEYNKTALDNANKKGHKALALWLASQGGAPASFSPPSFRRDSHACR